MTTEHIDGVTEAQHALDTVAGNVRARAQKVSDELAEAAKLADNIQIGARAALQGVNDNVGTLTEEAGQIHAMLGTSPQPSADSEPQPGTTVFDQDVALVPPPTPPDGDATAHVDVDVNISHRFNPRTWSGLQWLLAFIGLVVGLIVASLTQGFDEFEGAGHGWFTFGWVVAVAGTGFFLGGFIGSFVEDRADQEDEGT